MKLLFKYLLSNFGGRVTTKEEVGRVLRRFEENPAGTINFIVHYGLC